ncbi:MAG: hydrogenase maturation nickel metallochaperone HypA [Methanomicrobiales archaeon]|nr:hydrogenase maturation nickel metallochaperone HypA [Methanomicrobiales archaeon]
MHEYGIAYDIFATARKAARDNKATSITVIHVDLGEAAMVNADQVAFLFSVIAEEEPLFTGSRLECRKVPVRSRCGCGYEGEETFVCPCCGALPDLTQGKEIVVTSVEIEVADTPSL